jgi:uncharacterized protein YjiS (DUF1127 family)
VISAYFPVQASLRETNMRSQAYNVVSSGYPRQVSLFEACRHRVLEITKALRIQWREWRRRARTRNELITLSDSDLRDIRWTRAEVEAEARKPFWRA